MSDQAGLRRRKAGPGSWWLLLIGLAGLAAAILLASRPAAFRPAAELRLAPQDHRAEFRTALQSVPLRFPGDHGAHLEFQTEWWYFIGNLIADDGHAYGYQLTIFRRGLAPGTSQRESGLAVNHLYFAHFAVTDAAAGEHTAFDRYSRGTDGLAGSATDGLNAYLENWTAEMEGDGIRLQAEQADFALDLSLTARKPPVAHGRQGLSAKSEQPGNASYYLSMTDLDTAGSLTVDGRQISVRGDSWFDHEWGTSALGPRAVGWDWFGLQLDDGRDLMLFQIRRDDGGIEPVSGGTLVTAEGVAERIAADQIQLEVRRSWRSAASDAEYPVAWQIRIPDQGLDLLVDPLLDDQENLLGIVYWEGAVRVSGSGSGVGYMELTGYGGSLQGLY